MKKILRNALISLILFLGSSCQGIKWDPDFYVPDSASSSIINEKGHQVYCDKKEIEAFACLSEQKIKELKEILKKARIPEEYFREE